MAEVGRSLAELTRDERHSGEPHQEHQIAGAINDPLYLAGQTDEGILSRAREMASREQALWDEARRSRDREQVWHYLRRYPEGRFAPAALDMLDHIDWDEARKEARRTGKKRPVEAYLGRYPKGIHRKEALDFLRPVWKKPAFWLGLSAAVVAVGAGVGLGVGLTQENPTVLMPHFNMPAMPAPAAASAHVWRGR